MNIDVAIGGMDQRKAHMYMRDVASKYGWEKATCFHTHIISSLKSTGVRMESFDHKMSSQNRMQLSFYTILLNKFVRR